VHRDTLTAPLESGPLHRRQPACTRGRRLQTTSMPWGAWLVTDSSPTLPCHSRLMVDHHRPPPVTPRGSVPSTFIVYTRRWYISSLFRLSPVVTLSTLCALHDYCAGGCCLCFRAWRCSITWCATRSHPSTSSHAPTTAAVRHSLAPLTLHALWLFPSCFACACVCVHRCELGSFGDVFFHFVRDLLVSQLLGGGPLRPAHRRGAGRVAAGIRYVPCSWRGLCRVCVCVCSRALCLDVVVVGAGAMLRVLSKHYVDLDTFPCLIFGQVVCVCVCVRAVRWACALACRSLVLVCTALHRSRHWVRRFS
jgi:hypothetical protein